MNKPTFTTDYKAIEHILLNHYAEGGKQAKSEIMKPAFHDVATMYSADENGELTGGAVVESLFPVIDNHFTPSEPTVACLYRHYRNSSFCPSRFRQFKRLRLYRLFQFAEN